MNWIRVKGKMERGTPWPVHGSQVLCVHKHGVSEAEFLYGTKYGYPKPVFSEPYYGQTVSSNFEEVTHYCLMPKPPQK